MTPSIRTAVESDVRAIVQLLADDELGARRESLDDLAPYRRAFEAIQRDANHLLIVAEDPPAAIVGTLQLMFLPHMTHRGGWRAQVEGVRVAAARRGAGIGALLLRWAIERAADRGCRVLQLTTDKSRSDAVRFYEKLGFESTHEGMKLGIS